MNWNPPPYQPPQTFTPPPKLKLRPAAGWYALVAVPTLVIPLIGVVLLVSGISDAVGSIEPIDSNGEARAQLDEGERRGVYGDDVSSTGAQGCEVSAPNGERIAVDPQFGSYTVTQGSRNWEAVGRIEATTAGTYTLSCGAGAVAAFGPDPDIGGLFGRILGIVGLFFLGPLLGLAVFFVILAMRSRDKKRQQRQMGIA